MKNIFTFANLHVELFDEDFRNSKAIYVDSYNTTIGFINPESELAPSYFDGRFYSVTTRYHQGIASQILAYAKANKWAYIRYVLENSKTLKELKSRFGYSYRKNYVSLDLNYK